jgi:ADP-ribose pyrophosphatase YjhB (NUDIX family)
MTILWMAVRQRKNVAIIPRQTAVSHTRLSGNSQVTELTHHPQIRLRERRLAFENTRFRVYQDHIDDTQGAEVRDYLVVAPHTRREDLITGISVLPVQNGRIVLLKIFRHALGCAQLEVPRGFVDAGEEPSAAALRELAEETGLLCAPDKLVSLGLCAPEASTLSARVALFAATDCYPGEQTPEKELGLGAPESFSFPEALRMLREMSIEDVTTSLALHRFFLIRGLLDEGRTE